MTNRRQLQSPATTLATPYTTVVSAAPNWCIQESTFWSTFPLAKDFCAVTTYGYYRADELPIISFTRQNDEDYYANSTSFEEWSSAYNIFVNEKFLRDVLNV